MLVTLEIYLKIIPLSEYHTIKKIGKRNLLKEKAFTVYSIS